MNSHISMGRGGVQEKTHTRETNNNPEMIITYRVTDRVLKVYEWTVFIG